MKLHQISTADCKPGSGKKRAMRIAQNIDSVEELVLSQENAWAFRNNLSDSRDWKSQNVSA